MNKIRSNKNPLLNNDDSLFRENLLKKYDVDRSSLIFHNYSKKIASFVELLSPFMLLYERLNQSANQFTLMEFSNNNHYSVHAKYTDIEDLGDQPLHKHEFYEFTYVISGNLHMQIENDFFTFSSGECCLCNRNVRHLEMHDSDCEFLLIMLQKDFITDLLSRDYLGTNDYLSAHHPVIDCLRDFSCDETEYIFSAKKYITLKPKTEIFDANLELINFMINQWDTPAPGNNYLFFGYLCRFLGNIDNVQNYDIEIHDVKSNNLEDIFIKASFLIEESHGMIQRTELEQKIGYTGDYLTKIIRTFTDQNFVEYCQHFSLKEAERLITESALTIGEICFRLGYNNRTHFNKIFKKRYGMPPKMYRSYIQSQK